MALRADRRHGRRSGSRRSTKDTYHEDLLKRIKEKIKAGQTEEITEPEKDEKEAKGADVIDLMALLKKSVEGGKQGARESDAAASAGGGAASADAASEEGVRTRLGPRPTMPKSRCATQSSDSGTSPRSRCCPPSATRGATPSSPRWSPATRSSARSSAQEVRRRPALLDYEQLRRAAEERRDRRGLHRAAEQPARRVRRCARRRPACTCCARSRWR